MTGGRGELLLGLLPVPYETLLCGPIVPSRSVPNLGLESRKVLPFAEYLLVSTPAVAMQDQLLRCCRLAGGRRLNIVSLTSCVCRHEVETVLPGGEHGEIVERERSNMVRLFERADAKGARTNAAHETHVNMCLLHETAVVTLCPVLCGRKVNVQANNTAIRNWQMHVQRLDFSTL